MRQKTMTMGASFCRRAALAALVILAPFVALADDVTINVPVQLTRLAQGVTKGRVQCRIEGMAWVAPDAIREQSQAEVPAKGSGMSSEFSVEKGVYSGTVNVRVSVNGPPQAWIDSGSQIRTDRSPSYLCYLQFATASSGWNPEVDIVAERVGPSSTIMRIGAFRGQPPAWSLPASGSLVTVSGTLAAPVTR